jgi:hypothetical protein
VVVAAGVERVADVPGVQVEVYVVEELSAALVASLTAALESGTIEAKWRQCARYQQQQQQQQQFWWQALNRERRTASSGAHKIVGGAATTQREEQFLQPSATKWQQLAEWWQCWAAVASKAADIGAKVPAVVVVSSAALAAALTLLTRRAVRLS